MRTRYGRPGGRGQPYTTGGHAMHARTAAEPTAAGVYLPGPTGQEVDPRALSRARPVHQLGLSRQQQLAAAAAHVIVQLCPFCLPSLAPEFTAQIKSEPSPTTPLFYMDQLGVVSDFLFFSRPRENTSRLRPACMQA
jgi:hypothetical protein